ncbi:MAG: hypothetical protein K8H84_10170 [Sulfuricella denitrificans]|nr:hypothetical protein [Sulfuricella denitrificans]
MPQPIKVHSQRQPGGRCTLYALYAEELSSSLGLPRRIIHTDCRDAHSEGFPSLLVRDVSLQPSDGVILSPQDICAGLTAAGLDWGAVPDLESRLEAIQEQFLEGV